MGSEPETMSTGDPVDGERGHGRKRAWIGVHVGEQDGSGNSK